MSIVGGLDIHRRQATFDFVDTETGRVRGLVIAPADRDQVRRWLAERFAGRDDVAFALEAGTGWQAPGWAAALNDPAITTALDAIHQDPAHLWTVAALATRAGPSRAPVAKRFTALVGTPPLP